MRRLIFAAAALLLLAAPLHARELRIERFAAELVVRRDGALTVTERIRVQFIGRWNGLYRTIPVNYRTPQGLGYKLRLDVVSATDERGNALEIEQERSGDSRKLKIHVPNAEDATHEITLVYKVANGIRFQDEHDELYWNVTGDEWDVPVGWASARVYLPAEASGIRQTAFTGAAGATEREVRSEIAGNGIAFETTRPLGFHEGLTVVVGWDRGIVQRPTLATQTSDLLHGNWPLGIPLIVTTLLFTHWYRRGRDPEAVPMAVYYEPPEKLTPAEVGALVDNSADMRDITATIVDLAVRGYIDIEEKVDSSLFGLITNREYSFHLVRKQNDWAELRAHEAALLHGLFRQGAREFVETSDLMNTFYKEVPAIRRAVMGSLVDRRYYAARPEDVRKPYFALAGLIVFGSVPLASVAANKWQTSPVAIIIAAVLSALMLFIFGYFMPARTRLGALILSRVLGFQDFLARVEGDRMDRMIKSPEMFERFLPYALALNVQQSWARAFEGVYREPPQWFKGYGSSGFQMNVFTMRIDTMCSRAGSAMTSAPRSSGGSGFSGGSSGGGFGGGGGGGF